MLIVMRVVRRVALTFVAAASLFGCDDAEVVRIASFVVPDPANVDFGTVIITQDAVETVTLRNLEPSAARLGPIMIEDNCGGCFTTGGLAESVIAPFGEVPLQVRFRAVRIAAATATLTIDLSALGQPDVEVFMIGRGREAGCDPDVTVAPEAVNFGFVPAGGVGLSSFVVRSTGSCDLLVDRIRVVPETAPFRITTSTPTPDNPGVLASGAQVSVGLRAQLPLSATGTTTSAILIETNSPIEKNVPGSPGVIEVPLSALANRPPIADAGPDQTVEPWSRATLNGSGSTDPDGPDDALQYRWRLVNQPGGSTTVLERTKELTPTFWADLTGLYELELVVTDVLGLESEPARVVVEAFPTNAIRIELTWDHPDSDVDLHLIRAGGRFCECVEDVHYRDCGRTPDWFPEAQGANPRLDVDDRNGFGPENINLDGEGTSRFIPDGIYTIAVHYFASNSDVSTWPTDISVATVRVFVFGLLAAEFSRPLQNDGDLWTVGELRWPDRELVPIDSVLEGANCGIF